MDPALQVGQLRHELGTAAGAGGEDVPARGEPLIARLEPVARPVLPEAMPDAGGEIAGEQAPGSVEMRLPGGSAIAATEPRKSSEGA